MFEKNDDAHLEAMHKIQELMKNPEDIKNGLKIKEKSLTLWKINF